MTIVVKPVSMDNMYGLVNMCMELHAQTHLAHLPVDKTSLVRMAHMCMADMTWFGRLVWDQERDEAVGAMVGYVSPLIFSTASIGVEEGLYVRQDVENRAMYAATMLKDFVRWAYSRGASDVRTGVISNIDNYAVDVFYRRNGFKRIGTIYSLKHPGDM